jgi:hypothetical protein
MDLENVLNKPAPAPAAPAKESEPEITKFDDKSKTNMPLVVLWIATAISVIALGGVYLLSYSVQQQITDTKGKLDAKTVEIDKKIAIAMEDEVIPLKAVTAQLKKVKAERFSMVEFMPIFFEHINKNVTIDTFAVSSDGVISFSGKTDSFRAAAEQVMTLEAWQIEKKNALSGVTMGAVSASRAEDGAITVPISINATFNKALLPKAIEIYKSGILSPVTSGSAVTIPNTIGGSNE